MALYAGIDLHSTNNVVVVLDEKDKVVGRRRLANKLETGDIDQFDDVGNYVSHSRLMGSSHLSNGKRKGSGNTKNRNTYASTASHKVTGACLRHDNHTMEDPGAYQTVMTAGHGEARANSEKKGFANENALPLDRTRPNG